MVYLWRRRDAFRLQMKYKSSACRRAAQTDKAEGTAEMTRRWISIRAPWGIRIGQSWSQEDFEPPRRATWQRYEITQMLIDAAVKKGGGMSKERANFIVNKTLALATFWDLPMDHTEAADIVDNAINRRR